MAAAHGLLLHLALVHQDARLPFDELSASDIVITPAFGTRIETDIILKSKGIHTENYNTTCPFVEKVWNRSGQIAEKNFTVIIHGKPDHEETRATFSHAAAGGPALVIKDMQEAMLLTAYIRNEKTTESFTEDFRGRFSNGFDVQMHLQRIGVVNQTTMLAAETQQIADVLKRAVQEKNISSGKKAEDAFADTRDTLCYATNDNQSAVLGMLKTSADLAIVVGGYNSSNTSHLAELCELQLPFRACWLAAAFWQSNVKQCRAVRHYDQTLNSSLLLVLCACIIDARLLMYKLYHTQYCRARGSTL